MSNETKRNVFEKALGAWDDLVHELEFQGEESHGACEFDQILDKYRRDYATALPDDLPVIPKKVSQEIKVAYTKYSVTDELNWAYQDALPDPEVSVWIKDNETLFAEAWGRGLWVVEQTGKAESYD